MIDLLGNCLVFVILFEQCGNVVFLLLIVNLGRFRLSGVTIYTCKKMLCLFFIGKLYTHPVGFESTSYGRLIQCSIFIGNLYYTRIQ